MAFTALHPNRGRLDATVEDLGCGWDWAAVHRARPPVRLSCPECGHGMHAKASPLGLRFFAHYPGAPTCALAGESMEHHLLKLELAVATRPAGHHAELEVRGPDGSWRADVMATTVDGSFRAAWEAQLSAITVDEITRRTDRYRADGVAACWVTTRRAHWLGQVPSIRVHPPAKESADRTWGVSEGLARFTPARGWQPATTDLGAFVSWAMSGRIVEHRFPRTLYLGEEEIRRTSVWTAPAYLTAETDWHRAEQEASAQRTAAGLASIGGRVHTAAARRERAAHARAEREAADRRWAEARAAAELQAQQWHERMDLIDAAFRWFRARKTLTPADSFYSTSPGRLATGVQLYVNQRLVGLVSPSPELMRWERFGGVVFVRTPAERDALAVSAPEGARIVVLASPDTVASASADG